MKTLVELKKIQDISIDKYKLSKERKNGIRIVVGMSTCSIAAGAKQVYDTLEKEILNLKLNDITVSQVGCIGICKYEPVMEVFIPEQEKATYVNMTSEKVEKIIDEHVINGNVCTEYTIGVIR